MRLVLVFFSMEVLNWGTLLLNLVFFSMEVLNWGTLLQNYEFSNSVPQFSTSIKKNTKNHYSHCSSGRYKT